ncbi:hypothetical protein MNBD_ALPHA07-2228 [hydrothermal vent metagenome]|uniref:DUF3306 domain-containing protein n=1 Tax=hydrothermal vent metagenome TaxID=652676 RepID=A0A3B0S2F3_9ZZZZ
MSRTDTAWSRRRAGVKAEAEAETRAMEQAKRATEQAGLEKKTDAEILSELNLQDPDTMQPGDDFTAFMQSAVPERLRRRALRTLWRSNPVLANVDDLVDYGEDFKAESIAGAVIKTAYQVGKGMLKHTDEMEKQAREAELAEVDEETTQAVTNEVTDETPPEETLVAQAEYISPLSDDTDEETPAPLIKRRMRFAFEEAE